MCGIVGVIGTTNAMEVLIQGLSCLEYRGYDSAGIATIHKGQLQRTRAVGKLVNLKNKLQNNILLGGVGIGHTRWATHGEPTEKNAHPHGNSKVAVVHNGIIENYLELKEKLLSEGVCFESETDTEVVVHLLSGYLEKGLSPKEATASTLKHLKGAFALGMIFAGHDDLLIVARSGGSPLAIGYGDHQMFLGSDAIALAAFTNRICYLEEGDWAILTSDGAEIFNQENQPIKRPIKLSNVHQDAVNKNQYEHFMLKEIFEQPITIEKTIAAIRDQESLLDLNWTDVTRLTISACGTAYYAGSVAKYWFEQLAELSCDVDIASELRYRKPPLPAGGLSLFISQSGETIDTLAALEYAKEKNQHILSIINVPESSIARQSNTVLYTQAGPEIGVASTKAFTNQLTVLILLAIEAGYKRKVLSGEKRDFYLNEIKNLPMLVTAALSLEDEIKIIARDISAAKDVLFLGRGVSYPMALEGALKLKEITYIHAEGYAAGELKHGPIALVDDKLPIIVVAPFDRWFEKTVSNVQEVIARGAKVFMFTDKQGKSKIKESEKLKTFLIPETTPATSPIVSSIPLQLLAYHTALIKGTDVDQPRNLAKSVTVE